MVTMRRAALLLLALGLWSGCHRGSTTASSGATPASRASASGGAEAAEPSAAPDALDAQAVLSPEASAPSSSAAPSASFLAFPFGAPAPIARYSCPVVVVGGPFRAFLADGDTRVAFVDGDDLLALVNRSPTGALPPTYAPKDLVDLRDLSPQRPSACESGHACLRRDAAVALRRMFEAMKGDGIVGRVDSAFRGFGTQCWVFDGWAAKARGGFCEAATQSALPGHSQHQLGTTVDAFTSDWAEQGARNGEGVFRNGFGCTKGGRWFDDNAYRFGFVVSYPIDPDDRKDGSRCQPRVDRAVPIDPKTGYKHEPWHLRYVGVEAAGRYHDAWSESGPGTAAEITLEQWLRAQRGLVGDSELPVCDGCECGACATMEGGAHKNPCGDASLLLGDNGRVVAPREEPQIVDAVARKGDDGAMIVEVTVEVPAHTPTQTPVADDEGLAYAEGAAYRALAPYAGGLTHRYDDLPGAWRVAVGGAGAAGGERWPWRASLAQTGLGATWNRANVVLPCKAGKGVVRLRVPASAGAGMRVTLLRDGEERGTRVVSGP
jgi:D-alanyl-D-alanine carboxypeptidase